VLIKVDFFGNFIWSLWSVHYIPFPVFPHMTKEKNAPILSRLDLTSAFEKNLFVVLNFLLSIVVIQYLNYFFFIHNDRCIVNYQVSCIGFLRRYCFRTTSATCIGEVANSAYGESELVVFFRRFRILK
jgi:hypothetical protein